MTAAALTQPPAAQENSSFSQEVFGLQLAVDSTSLGEFKKCPRSYYYSIVQGWQQRGLSPHLRFGLLIHAAVEGFHRRKAEGWSYENNLRTTLREALTWTWNKELQRAEVIDHPQKTRASFIRALIWYLEQYEREPVAGLTTALLANGKPAVELSFAFQSGYTAHSVGQPFILCGHIDRVVMLGGDFYIADIKTTTHQLGPNWVQGFSPDNQFTLYTVAGKVAFGVEAKGLILDGVQVGATFARFQRYQVPRPAAVLTEWLQDLRYWLGAMEQCALDAHWPQNDKACGMYGGCQFREVCSRAPSARASYLQAAYVKRVWDPLKVRGDF